MKLKSAFIAVSPVEKINNRIDSASPRMSFNQIYIVSHKNQAASLNTLEWADPQNPPPVHLNTTFNYVNHVYT